ncbi:hypothetical protein ENHYD8BJ_90315 [Enhydrobacter sp. 8BJ]|nr:MULTISPECIES: DUF4236 domain-containing protein [Pseudomonadota]VXB85678.1 hypothetical protein ENHYD8BJ_90315 [Enhydrobacter sp. 8BJ]
MGLRFRKTIKVAPGIKLNVGKKSSSVSIGGKGFTTNYGKNGTRTTIGIPGTGVSYTATSSRRKPKQYKQVSSSNNQNIPISRIEQRKQENAEVWGMLIGFIFSIVVFGFGVWIFWKVFSFFM